MKPAFLITIDTEGDNLWSKPQKITTKNAAFLPRFQELCDKYSFKPTYLTNYEMAIDPLFIEFGNDVIQNDRGEIGMHLHAWNSPPIKPLTCDDFLYHPYLIEYPTEIMREKIKYMTDLLEDTFNVKMISHRAGRWAFNNTYAKLLSENGYKVDCSVTPYISWENTKGDPKKNGGPNYSDFNHKPYYIDINKIKESGDSDLLELPMTVYHNGSKSVIRRINKLNKNNIISRTYKKFLPIYMFRPGKNSIYTLSKIVKKYKQSNLPYIEFMLHSSEFMPGSSPVFKQKSGIEKLYSDLELLFQEISNNFSGMTLTEFYNHFSGK